MRTKPTPSEARLLKRLGLPLTALLAVSLGLPATWSMCAAVTGNVKCNSCDGKLCGQDGKSEKRTD